MTTTPSPKRRWRRYLGAALGVAVLVVVFGFVLPSFADYGDVWNQVTTMDPAWLVALGAAAVLNLSTYAPNWMVALPGLRARPALELQFTGTALANVAPLGGAVSMGWQYRMMREWGFTTMASSRAMVVTGVWNNLVNLGLPVIGLVWLTFGGGRNAALILAAEIGAALFVLVLGGFLLILNSDAGARAIAHAAEAVINLGRQLLRRPIRKTLAASMIRFRHDSLDLVKHRWLALTVTTLLGVLTLFLVLLVSVRAVGLDGTQVSVTEAFAAWSVTRLLSAIPLTPGGIGIIDVGLAGALTSFGGADAKVVAAVLLYRVLTFVPPVLLGAIAMFTWKRHPERHQPTMVS